MSETTKHFVIISGMDGDSQLVELLNRAREGDDIARDQLFNKCRNYVTIVARAHVESWLKVKVDPSDLVQQTMLEAHRGFADFRGETEGEWLAWLKQILSHNATDFVRHYGGTRKRQAKREISLQFSDRDDSRGYFRDPTAAGETPSELVMQHERAIAVTEAIAQLEPDYQEVIMLRNLQRLSFNEVAERMNRSRPAIQMLWMRALKKLEQLLKNTQ